MTRPTDHNAVLRRHLTVPPISDEEITACRHVLEDSGATDLAEMLGVAAG